MSIKGIFGSHSKNTVSGGASKIKAAKANDYLDFEKMFEYSFDIGKVIEDTVNIEKFFDNFNKLG